MHTHTHTCTDSRLQKFLPVRSEGLQLPALPQTDKDFSGAMCVVRFGISGDRKEGRDKPEDSMKEQQGAVRPLGQERVQAEDGKGRGTETHKDPGRETERPRWNHRKHQRATQHTNPWDERGTAGGGDRGCQSFGYKAV